MLRPDKTAHYSALFILIAGVTAVGLMIPRHHGWMLLFAYFSAFLGYFWYCRQEISWLELLVVGLGLRLALFLQMPSLSDDIFRFIWDGQLVANGISPYANLPSALKLSGLEGIDPALFNELNSPEYYSVYPPLNQLIFWLGHFGESYLTKTNLLRAILLVGELASLLALSTLLKDNPSRNRKLSLFFLNPLLILEVCGNLHFEGLVISFLLLGFLFLKQDKLVATGISVGLAIGTKLVPIIFLPALVFKYWFRKGLIISGIAAMILLMSFIPFLNESTISGMQSSLDLYFRNFEFNASVYFLAREIGYWITGYNMIHIIGPMLSMATFASIMAVVFWGLKKRWSVEIICLFSLSLYLLLATTVHPWYVLPLMALGILSGYYYPLVWTGIIFVTYFGYTENGYELSPLWIVLEYVIVLAAFGIENFKKNHATDL
ncbi:MAG: DUF2029 domain-containing protein [Cyclobacteriaceae bacterium]